MPIRDLLQLQEYTQSQDEGMEKDIAASGHQERVKAGIFYQMK